MAFEIAAKVVECWSRLPLSHHESLFSTLACLGGGKATARLMPAGEHREIRKILLDTRFR
jgi:hypothetical protein